MFAIEAGTVEISIFLLFGLGSMVGVLGGFFGVGGGWIITPTLHIFGMPMSYAVGTGLAYIMGMSFISFMKHRSSNAVEPLLGVMLGVGMMAGMWGGSRVVTGLEMLVSQAAADAVVRGIYILFLFSLGTFMLRDCLCGKCVSQEDECDQLTGTFAQKFNLRPVVYLKRSDIRVSLWPALGLGVAIGFFSGILGAGGGFLLVPALFYLIGVPTVVAVGTSLLCILIGSPFGVAAYAFEGRVSWFASAIMLTGVLIAAPLGAHAAHKVRGAQLRLLYAVMILCGGASVVLKELETRLDASFIELASKLLIFVAGGGIAFIILLMWFLAVRKEKAECEI